MMLILLGLLAYVEPGDTNIYGGMDANIAQYSHYWEYLYETSPSGFRTSQGCLDMAGWYQIYDVKTEADFTRTFSIRYRFHMLRYYADTITQHRFEPSLRIWKNLYAHLVIVPYYQKPDNETGLGLSWREGHRNWIAFYASLSQYDHNFSLMHTRPGPIRDPFSQIPYKFELDARGELDWLRVRLHGELVTRSSQYLDWPDSLWEVWERDHDSTGVWGRLEIRPVSNLWIGTRFNWERERTQTRWPGRENVTADTLRDRWVEPFVSLYPSDRVELRLEYRIWDVNRDMDSVRYYSDLDVFSSLISWQPFDFMLFEGGYQRSRRYRYNDDTTILEPWKAEPGGPQSRLLFNLEFRFKSGAMLSLKEGLEMDRFPRELFRSPHNHTYVLLHLPLVLPRKKDPEPSSEEFLEPWNR